MCVWLPPSFSRLDLLVIIHGQLRREYSITVYSLSTECGRCYAFLGAWLRAGEGIGWLAAGTMPNSLYRMPLVYLFLACVFCYSCSFLFVVFCVFVFFFCSHWSLIDVPLIFFCPADHVPDWQPRILLGMVEARSVNVKKTTTVYSTRRT